MGYFDRLADSGFRTTASGAVAFYPYGAMGRGYVLQSEAERRQLRAVAKGIYLVSLPLLVAAQLAGGAVCTFAVVVGFLAGYAVYIRLLFRGHAQADERLRFKEAMQRQAQLHRLPSLIFMEAFSIAIMVLGLDLLWHGKLALGALVVAVFGFSSCIRGYMIACRLKEPK